MSPDAESIVNEYDALANAPECGIAELAVIGRDLDQLISNLQAVRKTIGSRIADIMDGAGTVTVMGVGVLERSRTTRWVPINDRSHELLARHIGALTRGVSRSPATVADNVATALIEAASPTWRIKYLRELDLKPTDYLDVKNGDWSVKIPQL